MKVRPVAKIDKRIKKLSKKFDDDIILANSGVIVSFTIYGQFGAIHKPDFGRKVCKTYIFNNSNFLSCKNWKQN